MANPKSIQSRAVALQQLNDEELLDLRLCDLNLTLETTPILAQRVQRLYAELARKHLAHFRPHCWLSSEWFSPDGVPGIAIPFYLAHPRLIKLEKSQVLQVEGGTNAECMRILRHEVGHCIDTAYRLHFRKAWREHFGFFSEPYPNYYHPKPGSRRFVQHLDYWYAQAHPAEDFAETFAVWLSSGSRWRQRYENWPALRKLEYVDRLMKQVVQEKPKLRSHRKVEPLQSLRITLREYYREKRLRYASEWPEFFDLDLGKLFSSERRFAQQPTAAMFLRCIRPEIRAVVSRWTATHPYTIDQVLRDMIDRCKELKLRLALPEDQARREATIMVTVQTMNYVHSHRHRVAL